jgi:hypothetical protein
LGLVNSWSSAATDRTSDADGSSSPAEACDSPAAAAAAVDGEAVVSMQHSKASFGCSSPQGTKGNPAVMQIPEQPEAACACVEDVVVQVAGAGAAAGTSTADLYDLD